MGLSFYAVASIMPLYLVEKMQVNGMWMGLIMSSYVIAAIVSRPYVGHLLDNGNKKYIYLVIFALFALAYFGYIWLATAVGLLVVRIVHGLIWGGMTTAGSTFVAGMLSPQNRGSGLGYYGVSLTLAMCLGPIVGLSLYNSFGLDMICLLSVGLCLIGMVSLFPIKYDREDVAQELSIETPPTDFLDKMVLKIGIPLAINVTLVSVSYGVILVYAAIYGKQLGASNPGYFFILMGLGTIASRFGSGKYIDRGRVPELSVISIGILTLSFALLALIPNVYVFYACSFSMGVGFGVFVPTFQTMGLNIAGRHRTGAANSTFFTAYDFGIGVGMIMGGQIAGLLNINWAFGISAVLNALAIVYYYMISHHHYKRYKNLFK